MKISRNVRSMISDEGAVLRDTDTGITFGLNPIGAEIWNMLQEGIPVEEIIDRIILEYDAPRLTIETHVKHFVQELKDHALVAQDNAEDK
jgi:hypothetical protein